MKIGAFSKKHHMTIDTIRHYISLGMINPIKEGAHYYFSEQNNHQASLINDLKQVGFKLQEIKQVLLYQNLTPLDWSNRQVLHKTIYSRRLSEVKEEMETLRVMEEGLRDKLTQMESDKSPVNLGLPLACLDLLACPRCQQSLSLNATCIRDNQVHDGSLVCGCSYQLEVKAGMLVDASAQETNEALSHEIIMSYIDKTPLNYLLETNKSIGWLADRQVDAQLEGVHLDVGSGFGLYMQTLLAKGKTKGVYICNDKDLATLTFLKSVMETAGIAINLVFLACDLKQLPLKHQTLDSLSTIGTGLLVYEDEQMIMDHLNPLMKDHSHVFALESVYDKVSDQNAYAYEMRHILKEEPLKGQYTRWGYDLAGQVHHPPIYDGGPYEPTIQASDKMHFMSLHYIR